ncbi:MAG: glycosyltransferase family 2 protein [Flavobacteriaceae bacterium]
MIKLSVVTTLYNSDKFILEFVDRITSSVKKLKLDFEIIFVDDGSLDNSASVVESLAKSKTHIKLIKFSRNYGHHIAMVAGLEKAQGNYVFLIDVDLEEEPELLVDFYNRITKTKDDLIYGIQTKRNKDRILGILFWKILNLFTGLDLSTNPCTVRIMSYDFVQKLKEFPQKDFFLGELSSYIGLKQSTINVKKLYKGHSSYSFLKKYTLLFNMLFTNVNNLWVRLSFFAALMSILSFLFVVGLLISYLLGKTYLSGWLSLMVVITFFASINFFFFGAILQFMSKVLEETRSKPRFIIEKTINFDN